MKPKVIDLLVTNYRSDTVNKEKNLKNYKNYVLSTSISKKSKKETQQFRLKYDKKKNPLDSIDENFRKQILIYLKKD